MANAVLLGFVTAALCGQSLLVAGQTNNNNSFTSPAMLAFNAALAGSCNSTQMPTRCVQQQGQCVQFNDTHYVCYCRNGFVGPICAEDVDECSLQTSTPMCANNANCTNTFGSFQCNCEPGFDGRYCEKRLAPCDIAGACEHGGVCVSTVIESDLYFNQTNANFTCLCPNGYVGRRCEASVDECQIEPSICEPHGRCVAESNGTYNCKCEFPYQGRNCQLSPCDFYPCQNGAQCQVANNTNSSGRTGGYICICPPGFTGTQCQTSINDCSNIVSSSLGNYSCNGRGVCSQNSGRNSFSCVCQTGYAGDNCEISLGQQCAASNRCNSNGTLACVDDAIVTTGGGIGYHCECAPGYSGYFCDSVVDYCTEHPLACKYGQCVSLVGGTDNSYRCKCPSGLYGAQCEHEDCGIYECYNGGACVATPSNGPYCACAPGWFGPQCRVPENACEMLHEPCQNGALCESTDFTTNYTCYCAPDFFGAHCEFHYDKNCATRPCLNEGVCVDQNNSFICQCRAGVGGATCEQQIDNNTTVETPLTVVILSAASYSSPATTTTTPFNSTLDAEVANSSRVAGDDDLSPRTSVPPTIFSTNNNNQLSINITTTNDSTSIVSFNSTYPLTIEVVEPQTEIINITSNNSALSAVNSTTVAPSIQSTTNAPARIIIKPNRYTDTLHNTVMAITTRRPYYNNNNFATIGMQTISAQALSTTNRPFFNETTITTVDTSRMPRLVDNSQRQRRRYDPASVAFSLSRAARQVVNNMSECLNGGLLHAGRLANGSVVLQCDCPVGFADFDCSLSTRVTPHARFLGYSYLALPSVTIGMANNNNNNELIAANNSLEMFMRIQPQLLTGLVVLLLDTVSAARSRGLLYLQNGTLIFEGRCGWAQDVIKVDSGIQLHMGESQMVYVRLTYPTAQNSATCSVLIQVDDKRVQAEKRAQLPLQSLSGNLSSFVATPVLPRQIVFDGVFVGGHPNASPNFTGCISEFLLQGVEINLMSDAVAGWNVVPCGTIERNLAEEDELLTSSNGQCALQTNPCTGGSVCIPPLASPNANNISQSAPVCLCNTTQHGQYCERSQLQPRQPRFFNDPNLTDYVSYAEYPTTLTRVSEFQLQIIFTIDRPTALPNKQLLVYIGSLDVYSEFIAIVLNTTTSNQIDAVLLVKFGPQVLTLSHPLSLPILQRNHSITVHFIRNQITLNVDEYGPIATLFLNSSMDAAQNINQLPFSRFHTLNSDGRIFVGSVPNTQMLPAELQQLNAIGFRGCIEDVRFSPGAAENAGPLQLNASILTNDEPVAGRNIYECADYQDWCNVENNGSTGCGRYAACVNIGASFHLLQNTYASCLHTPRCTCFENSTLGSDGRCRLINPCADSQCPSDALCVADYNQTSGYRCVCPLGFDGQFCENQITIGLPQFRGELQAPSFVTLDTQHFCLQSSDTLIRVHILPTSRTGLIVYASGTLGAGGFSFLPSPSSSPPPTVSFTLALVDGQIEMRFDVTTTNGSDASPVIITTLALRSNAIVGDSEAKSWIYVAVQRNSASLFQLRVDNVVYSLPDQPPATAMLFVDMRFSQVFVGGLPTSNAIIRHATTFSGCMANLFVGEQPVFSTFPAISQRFNRASVATNGLNISQLSGYGVGSCTFEECRVALPSAAVQCQNNGRCVLERNSSRSVCDCLVGYEGDRCQLSTSCAANQCANDSQCIETSANSYRCACPLGQGGRFCTQALSLRAISLAASASYLLINTNSAAAVDENNNNNDAYIEFEFRPETISAAAIALYYFKSDQQQQQQRDATMIMYMGSSCSEQDDFIGIGLEAGRIKVVFNVGLDSHTILVSNATRWQWFDGSGDNWIRVTLQRQAQNVRVTINSTDGFQHEMQTSSTGLTILPSRNVSASTAANRNAIGTYYFGAFPLSSRLSMSDYLTNITSAIHEQERQRIVARTFGYFTQRFRGCLRNIRLGRSAGAAYVNLDGSLFIQPQGGFAATTTASGQGIEQCTAG